MRVFVELLLLLKAFKFFVLVGAVFLTAGCLASFQQYDEHFLRILKKLRGAGEKDIGDGDRLRDVLVGKLLAALLILFVAILTISGVSGYSFKDVAFYFSSELSGLVWDTSRVVRWSLPGGSPSPQEEQREAAVPPSPSPNLQIPSGSGDNPAEPPVTSAPPRPVVKMPLGTAAPKRSVSQTSNCGTSDIGEEYCVRGQRHSTSDHVFR
jgi:hypothetical protein